MDLMSYFVLKQLTVVRMIMKDSIEYDLYVRNSKASAQQVELDFHPTTTNERGIEVEQFHLFILFKIIWVVIT